MSLLPRVVTDVKMFHSTRLHVVLDQGETVLFSAPEIEQVFDYLRASGHWQARIQGQEHTWIIHFFLDTEAEKMASKRDTETKENPQWQRPPHPS